VGPGIGIDTDIGADAGVDADVVVPRELAVADLYRTHRLSMVRLAILLVDDLGTAEDIVQDAFAALYDKWPRLRGTGAAVQYLRVTVVNRCRSALRRRRTARLYAARQPNTEPVTTDEPLLGIENRYLLDAIGRLAPRQREVLVLRYWLDLSEEQISATLGISRGAVRSTASRALRVLERHLEGSE
jgi:RNA polymerase sigma-70 factor (sigma-E family)